MLNTRLICGSVKATFEFDSLELHGDVTNFNITTFDRGFEITGRGDNQSTEYLTIPITNLVAGTRYEIEMSFDFGSTRFSTTSGAFGYCVIENPYFNATDVKHVQHIVTSSNADVLTACWTMGENTTLQDAIDSTVAKSSFVATSDTMYFYLDFSSVIGTYLLFIPSNFSINVSNISIKKIPVPRYPCLDMAHADIGDFSFAVSGVLIADVGYGSYKVYYSNTDLIFSTYSTTSRGFINIPIINLIANHNYYLEFEYERYGSAIGDNSSRDFSYGIKNSKLVEGKSYSLRNDSSCHTNKNASFTDRLDFTATNSTMYLNWNMADLSNRNMNRHIIKNAIVHEIY